MTTYPFLIRGPTKQSRRKKVLVSALSLRLAMGKILMRYPAKFVNSKFARRMDLMSAKAAAIKESNKKKGKTVYIIVDEKDGECDLSGAPLRGVYTAFKNGSEIGLPSTSEVSKVEPKQKGKRKISEKEFEAKKGKLTPTSSTKENASTPIQGAKTNTSMAKKANAKAAKKSAPKATGTGKATTLILSDAQWAKIEKLTEKEGSIREMVAKAMIKTFGL